MTTLSSKSRRFFGRSLALVLAAALLVGAGPSAAFAAGVSRVDIFKTLKVDQVSGDVIVLVDTSASMKSGGAYGQVRTALSVFLKALSPKDHLSLLTYDVAPAIRYSGTIGNGQAAVRQLPAVPAGQRTDIGAAIEAALNELGRPDAADVATVILVTDGVQDPPVGSKYPSASRGAWSTLRRRAVAIGRNRTVKAYALGIGGKRTDAAVLKSVFPEAALVALPSNQLGPYFDRVKEEARIAKAQQVLGTDLNGMVRATWQIPQLDLSSGRADVKLTLSSTTKYIPLVVARMNPSVQGLPGSIAGLPPGAELSPGQSRSYDLSLTWRPPEELRIGKRAVQKTGTLSVAGAVTSPWTQVLDRDLGLSFAPSLESSNGGFSASGLVGIGWVTASAIAALVLVLLGFLWLQYLWTKPKLRGTLTVAERIAGSAVVAAPTGTETDPGEPVASSGSSLGGTSSSSYVLGGRRVKIGMTLRTPKMSGEGTVRGRWVPAAGPGKKGSKVVVRKGLKKGKEIELTIRYRLPGGKWQRVKCAWGKAASGSGVSFNHKA